MRVAVSGWFWDQLGTGSGQYLAALAEWLPAVSGDAYEFTLVRQAGRGADAGPSGWRSLSVATPFDRASANLAKLWFEQVSFPAACRRLRAGVALVPYWGAPWWQPCPFVVTIHDLIPLILPLYRGGPLQRLYTWLVSRTAGRAQAVLTDSEASRRDILARLGLPAGRVHAIHLAANREYRPVADRAVLDRVTERYRLPVDPFFIYLGGFDARKNVLGVVEAYGRLVRQWGERPLPGLVIAGRLPAGESAFAPDPRPAVERLGLSDRVHFTGWVDEEDKPALYSLACAALFLSEYEGFGLPVLEAQACGCPVITSAQ